MRVAGEPAVSGGTAQDGFRNPFQDTVNQPVAEARNACGLGAQGGCGLLSGSGEGCDRRRVQGARADVPFLASAVLDGGKFHGPPQQERTHPNRAADLVAGNGHGVKA
jgi:hypothetical protein